MEYLLIIWDFIFTVSNRQQVSWVFTCIWRECASPRESTIATLVLKSLAVRNKLRVGWILLAIKRMTIVTAEPFAAGSQLFETVFWQVEPVHQQEQAFTEKLSYLHCKKLVLTGCLTLAVDLCCRDRQAVLSRWGYHKVVVPMACTAWWQDLLVWTSPLQMWCGCYQPCSIPRLRRYCIWPNFVLMVRPVYHRKARSRYLLLFPQVVLIVFLRYLILDQVRSWCCLRARR